MGRAFEYRKATKLKRWGHMAKRSRAREQPNIACYHR